MRNVQKNIASQVQKTALELCEIKARLTSISAMWTNEAMSNLTDADFAELAEFEHVTAVEFGAAAGALVATNTTLGTDAASNWAKLLKIVDRVP